MPSKVRVEGVLADVKGVIHPRQSASSAGPLFQSSLKSRKQTGRRRQIGTYFLYLTKNLKQNKAQFAHAESTHKGVNYRPKSVTQVQQQRPEMYLWWSLCTLYLHACQVRVTIGDSGLCCTCVTCFKC